MKRNRCNGAHVLLVRAAYAAMMAGVAAVCMLLPGIAYGAKRETLPNLLLLPCAAIALALLTPLLSRAGRAAGRAKRPLLLAVSLAAMLVQAFMASRYYFYTDWDVATIVESAMAAHSGADILHHSNYFSMYPNNLPLVTLFGWVIRLAHAAGFGAHAYFAMIAFQCLISWAAGALTCLLTRHVTGSDFAAAVSCLLYALLVGLSPWVTIPYSDSVGLFFPVALLAVLLMMKRDGKTGLARMFLLAFLAVSGYRIKPQIIIVLIAAAMMASAAALAKRAFKPCRGTACRAAAFGAGALCAALACNAMAADVGVELDENKTFGPAHYLMMGLNTETFGAYAQRDVSASWRMEDKASRTAMNLETAAQRLGDMGPVGLAQQVIRKTLTNYNDGTFCWGYEGVFFREILPEPDGVLAPVLRDVYYGPDNGHTGGYGRFFPFWQNGVQAVWLLTLALSALCAALVRDERLCVVMLTLIGLTLFETLFEARARYLYCFAPLYVMLAASGLDALRSRLLAAKKA